jgi:hypothetical protein
MLPSGEQNGRSSKSDHGQRLLIRGMIPSGNGHFRQRVKHLENQRIGVHQVNRPTDAGSGRLGGGRFGRGRLDKWRRFRLPIAQGRSGRRLELVPE